MRAEDDPVPLPPSLTAPPNCESGMELGQTAIFRRIVVLRTRGTQLKGDVFQREYLIVLESDNDVCVARFPRPDLLLSVGKPYIH